MDAVLTTAYISSFVMLSLSPLFRRQWPSLYEALKDGRPQRNKLMRLYIEQIPTDQRPVLVGDHTNYPRLDAKTLKDRTYEHQPTSIPGNKPVTIGQGYSTIAWVPEGVGSWALPLRHERITSFESGVLCTTPQKGIVHSETDESYCNFYQADCCQIAFLSSF